MAKRRKSGKEKYKFLMPGRDTFGILSIIIIAHIFLSLGLASGSVAYSVLISILYSVFNFPLFITGYLSFSGYNIYTLTSRAIIPLAAHIVYWYLVSLAISKAVEENKESMKYRKMAMILGMFLAFFLLFSIVISLYIGRLIAA